MFAFTNGQIDLFGLDVTALAVLDHKQYHLTIDNDSTCETLTEALNAGIKWISPLGLFNDMLNHN